MVNLSMPPTLAAASFTPGSRADHRASAGPPYFTPDQQTLFVNVQHPGEQTGNASDAPGVFGHEQTYTSWWPEGDRSRRDNPATPKPSTVAITRVRRKRR